MEGKDPVEGMIHANDLYFWRKRCVNICHFYFVWPAINENFELNNQFS